MEKEKEQPQEERLVKLTGLPISGRMKEILAKLGQGEGVTLDEIKDTPEMKLAESNVNDATPSYKLTNRDNLTSHIKEEMLKTGSAVIDSSGKTEYNGLVEKSSRLDIVIGLPASGKSSAIVDVLSSEFHSRVIDNDEAKKMIPQYNDGWGAGVVHVESQNISDDVFDISINQGDNIVLPKVGSDADKLVDRYIAQAKECGYKVNIHYVELDRNKAMSRMINRFIDQGRYLAPELIEKYAPLGRENRIDIAYGELKDSGIIDGYSKWDNDVALGERPVLIETNCKGGFIENARRDERTRINEEVAVAGEGILAGTQGGLVSADLRGGRSSARSERGIQENAQGRSEQAVAHRKNEASKQDKQVVQDRQHTGDERGGDFVATRRNAGAARGLGSEAGMDKGEACRAGKGAEQEAVGTIRPSARAKLEAYKTKAAAASRQVKPPERGGIGNEQL